MYCMISKQLSFIDRIACSMSTDHIGGLMCADTHLQYAHILSCIEWITLQAQAKN